MTRNVVILAVAVVLAISVSGLVLSLKQTPQSGENLHPEATGGSDAPRSASGQETTGGPSKDDSDAPAKLSDYRGVVRNYPTYNLEDYDNLIQQARSNEWTPTRDELCGGRGS